MVKFYERPVHKVKRKQHRHNAVNISGLLDQIHVKRCSKL